MAKIIITITDKLTPKQKLIFTLRDLEGLKVEKYKLLLFVGREDKEQSLSGATIYKTKT